MLLASALPSWGGEQGGIGHRHAERHQLPRLARLQHLEHQIIDVHRTAVVGLLGQAGYRAGGAALT